MIMESKPFKPIATCSPSSANDSYIYSIVPTSDNGLAVISSSDELVILDRTGLRKVLSVGSSKLPTGVTCLQPGDHDGNIVVCAGRDGSIVTLDVRSQAKIANIKLDRAVTSLACRDTEIAVGTELAQQQAIVSVWDRRQNAMKWQSTENNDDITDLRFHASRRSHLLSGGIDGLVSVFDTNINDEDDSLLQVVNHGPIHKAGFVSEDAIFALSHDEQLSIHGVISDTEEAVNHFAGPFSDTSHINADDIPPVHFGDLRPVLQCDYAIDVMQVGGECFVATGTHSSEPHVDIVHLLTLTSPRFLYDETVRLIGAHGEEIVRSIYVDDLSGIIYTAGEDGQVIAFRAEQESHVPSSKISQIKKGTKHLDSVRYRPY